MKYGISMVATPSAEMLKFSEKYFSTLTIYYNNKNSIAWLF